MIHHFGEDFGPYVLHCTGFAVMVPVRFMNISATKTSKELFIIVYSREWSRKGLIRSQLINKACTIWNDEVV